MFFSGLDGGDSECEAVQSEFHVPARPLPVFETFQQRNQSVNPLLR
jgi:hypothetical protein